MNKFTNPDRKLDWLEEADRVRLEQEPLGARAIVWGVAVLVVILLVWAAYGELDEVTRAQARVVPSTQLQIIQAVDGGVVEELLVREGQEVNVGDLLLRIDPTRFVSSLQEKQAEYLSLQAKMARLQALTEDRPLEFPDSVMAEAPDVAEHERRLYESVRESMAVQVSVVEEQLAQRQQELNEALARQAQAGSALAVVERELSVTRPLVKSGAVSEVEVLRLEGDASRWRGERSQAAAQAGRARSAIAEAERKIEEVKLDLRNRMRLELSETMSRLASLSEGSRALADRVRHAEVRSPVRGTVVRLRVNTLGAVVQPGRELVEILPLDDALVLEARVSPRDIAFLRPGLDAHVKFTAYDFNIFGGLDATLEHISADVVTDEQGAAFYLARLRTHRASLGEGLPIIPGMMAEVDILTGKRTVLSYLLKPVIRAKANAMTER
jgi:adhesin transport system membrane fusion protein